ncbi:MAG: DUF4276 family protein [Isosphaeraceae bacterium]
MKGLVIFCEGPTEQGFCRKVLYPHLFPNHDGRLHPILIAHSRHHGRVSRGGVAARYEAMRRGIVDELKGHKGRDIVFTTLIDLYGLPADFPGKDRASRNPAEPVAYAQALEKAFEDDIGDRRFLAHLQLHEYEAMLFAEPESFRIAFDDCDRKIEELRQIATSFPTVEHIDDGRATAPSKRIINLFPDYEGRKTSAGPDIANSIGLTLIRKRCPHFSAWLTQLESHFLT